MLEKPIRNRRAERREATKVEILDAAWELVRAEGLTALALRDLASRVGMQAPSLYSYFDSKHAIYDAMFAQGCRAYLANEQATPITGDALTDLRAGMHRWVKFCTDDPVRYQLLFQRAIPGFEPTPESYAISVEGLELTRSRLIAMGFEDPAVLDLLTAIGAGIAAQQLANDPGGDRWIRLLDEAMEMFYTHVSHRNDKGRKTKNQNGKKNKKEV